jgi:hypothetical protein
MLFKPTLVISFMDASSTMVLNASILPH